MYLQQYSSLISNKKKKKNKKTCGYSLPPLNTRESVIDGSED